MPPFDSFDLIGTTVLGVMMLAALGYIPFVRWKVYDHPRQTEKTRRDNRRYTEWMHSEAFRLHKKKWLKPSMIPVLYFIVLHVTLSLLTKQLLIGFSAGMLISLLYADKLSAKEREEREKVKEAYYEEHFYKPLDD